MSKSQPGERNGKAVLTDAQAEMIRGLYSSPYDTPRKYWTRRQLAVTFEISENTVKAIVQGQRRP
jgi:hypothetical protein